MALTHRACMALVLSLLCLSTVDMLRRLSISKTLMTLTPDGSALQPRGDGTSRTTSAQSVIDARRAERRAELEKARDRLRTRRWGSKEDEAAEKSTAPRSRFYFPSLRGFGGFGASAATAGATAASTGSDGHNIPSYLLRFNYTQPALRNPCTLPDPRLYENDTVIVLVLSARDNFDRRRAIRETWGKDHPVYFVVGGPFLQESNGSRIPITAANASQQQRDLMNGTAVHNGSSVDSNATDHPPLLAGRALDVQRRLEEEQETFHDLLDSRHPDSYRSLTHKLRFGYTWVLQRHPRVEWLVKVDDDTVVRVDTLATAFLRNFNPTVPMVIGRIIEDSPVHRTGKWAELVYPKPRYPFWPQGSCGHVVSRAVAQYVASASNLTYYQGEDVSLGIWLDESDLVTTWVHSEYFSNDRKCLLHAWLIMGHEVSEREMRQCYMHADEWPIEDIKHKHRRYWKVTNLYQWHSS
jgi:Galactosyltransferase